MKINQIIFSFPQKTQEEWQFAFLIAAAIYVFGGVFFLFFATASVQKWAITLEPEESSETTPESKKMINMKDNKDEEHV